MKSGNLLEDFQWERAANGYRWRKARGGQLLVPVQDGDAPAVMEKYRLGDRGNSGLFLSFTESVKNLDSALDFANRYGLLGYPVTVLHYGTRWKHLNNQAPDWFEEGDEAAGIGVRGEFFHLDPDAHRRGSWTYHAKLMRWLVEARQQRPPGWVRKEEAEYALRDSVWPCLDDALVGSVKPVSLIGAMWLQATLDGGREYKNCPVCGTPIEISRKGGARKDATFCSSACKSSDYRQRKAEALQLIKKHQPREVAKLLRTTAAKVRKWTK